MTTFRWSSATVCAVLSVLAAVTPAVGQMRRDQLREVRETLSGEDKDLDRAEKMLDELLKKPEGTLSDSDRCYAYVYMGYIEDHRRRRAEAAEWFKKALMIEGEDLKWVRQLAKTGTQKSVTWIRHLDSKETPQEAELTDWRRSIFSHIGAGVVARSQPPRSILPDTDLTPEQRLENFDVLCRAIDENFSFFKHKDIDWAEIQTRRRLEVEQTATTEEFYAVMDSLVRDLRDFHAWLCNYSVRKYQPWDCPGLATRLIEGRAAITSVRQGSEAERLGIAIGSIIEEIDGEPVERQIERIQAEMRPHGTERALLEEAYRKLLWRFGGSTVKLKLRGPSDGDSRTVELGCTEHYDPETPPPSFLTDRMEYVWSGRHPSGVGYIRILSFSGRNQVADEFERALEKLKDTPALVIDIRDNPGGFGTGQDRIVGRFLTRRALAAVSFTKNGSGHDEFKRNETWYGPSGSWQYDKPTALLINPGTGSAADLFAAYFTSCVDTKAVGGNTHGNLTGSGVYAVLPCNLVVRISNGYVCDARGRVIEGQGIEPDYPAEQTISDLVAGRDSVMERAVELLMEH